MADEPIVDESTQGAQPADSPPAQGPSDEGGSDQGGDSPATDTSADKGGVQKRIDQLTERFRNLERENAYLRGQVSAKAPVIEEKPIPRKVLRQEDFDSEAEYQAALIDQAKDELRKENEAERTRAAEEARKATMLKAADESRKKYPDFDSVALNTSIPVTPTMFEAAMGDNLGEILYYLGKNPGEAARISTLPATSQIKEIGRLEATLTNPTPKPKTNAPNPPATVKGAGGSPPAKPESKLSRAELRAKWDAERRKKAGVA